MFPLKKILQDNADENYARFMKKLLPSVDAEKIIGCRTPFLKSLAKKIRSENFCAEFLQELPHEFFEENQLHGFIISDEKKFSECIFLLEKFLPFVDNWATCDQTSPKIFKFHKTELLPFVEKWISSEKEFTIRFGVGMLMKHFLDENFQDEFFDRLTKIKNRGYYVKMEIAWFTAEALSKQWESAVKFLQSGALEKWTHNKAIQKATESFKISPEQKEFLKNLKR
jgi:3-methyladenine DNA glycosylase AlkD